MTQYVTVAGYGSLLSEPSAKTSCPSLKNYRLGILPNWQRIFNKVHPFLLETESTLPCLKRSAAVTIRPATGINTQVALIDIPEDELDHYFRREHDYDFTDVTVKLTDGSTISALTCISFKNEEDYIARCSERSTQIWAEIRQKHNYDGPVYCDDILPDTAYITRITNHLKNELENPELLADFLDNSWLADGKTTLREYVKQEGLLSNVT